MSQNLKVAIIQTELHWQNVEANLQMFEDKIMSIAESIDLIVLPEMFSTGFTMDATNNAEEVEGVAFSRMRNWAVRKKLAICGSVIVKDNDSYFNRLYFVHPDGSYQKYDKRHLFRMANEDQHYTAGNKKVIVEYRGWNICPLVCYDLRFPVWSRNENNGYDLLLYVANWPSPRSGAWRNLLKARATENLSYCIGVNRIGSDENGFEYSGDSAVIDFKGDTLFEHKNDPILHITELSKVELEVYRKKFPAHLDADNFEIK